MKLQECYAIVGNYAAIKGKLMSDRLVQTFLTKFLEDTCYSDLVRCLKEGDYPEAFHMAHTLRGVAANLGLTRLEQRSGAVEEKLRPQRSCELSAELAALTAEYDRVIAAIEALDKTERSLS